MGHERISTAGGPGAGKEEGGAEGQAIFLPKFEAVI